MGTTRSLEMESIRFSFAIAPRSLAGPLGPFRRRAPPKERLTQLGLVLLLVPSILGLWAAAVRRRAACSCWGSMVLCGALTGAVRQSTRPHVDRVAMRSQRAFTVSRDGVRCCVERTRFAALLSTTRLFQES